MAVERKQYRIDFVYTENNQMFGTGALLSAHEKDRLEKKLETHKENGHILDPNVYEPDPDPPQTLKDVLAEIAAAIAS